MTDQHIKGRQREMHAAPEDEGLSLAWMGLPKASMAAWMHFQGKLAGDLTPCAGRPEWTSGNAADKRTAIRLCGDCHAKAACLEFAIQNDETNGIYGGHDMSKPIKKED